MSEINPQELQDLATSYQTLIASRQTLLLSTASASGVPDISYAPFVRDHAGVFYLYVSKMACHTTNLLNNPQASILFIRSESESRNLFARERAVLNCSVQEISRNDAIYPDRLQALQEKFGEVVSVLRSLSDFHLFALRPENGRYVIGFGRAFAINVQDGTLLHI
ncbi:Pyridoxamine 5'-phosphate oxidase-related FMN-binding protein [Crenothrix polyspora]|uniref:Pyridoxamine 5'-phosphate oxidase-related FMN-binding protein n=1 Tax=Crenothrix polyspora TaxID=360316 RepID=A0A1R4H742_9GAMM|nr:pyridoxamine 5'-phosphate oxidase family protein [Crenothrix polyspora]SJM92009.1 Pyridoxamine 5'-phosphate oxidase-related FMN-binding protein [Crenothrix polyspora]